MKFNLKKVIASVAALAMSLSCFTAFAADFSDVADTASYKAAIDELVALKVINGYEDGTFKPDNEITRAEVTKMVVAAMGPSYTAAAESSKGNSGFSDVDPVNHWASGFIGVGVAQKFINGMGDGTFAPDANVTYAQIVKMLVAALGYESAASIAGGFPNGYLQVGASIGVTEGVSAGQDTAVTRAQVAQLISNAIDTPLVVVKSWSTNYLTGEPVAETQIMDGEEGRAYKTLLTENHKVYKVKGRVTATHAQGVTEKGKVSFNIEYSDNYDGEKIDAKTTAAELIDAFVGDTDAENQLFTYAEALIALDADKEATLLTVLPYGKNDIVELDAEDYVAAATAGTLSSVDFTISKTSSKTKTYKLDNSAKVYVNGILIDKELDTDGKEVANNKVTGVKLSKYVVNNKIGKVTLIDTPAPATTSKDGNYDYIMIDYPLYAVVDSTNKQGDSLKIYLDEFEAGVGTPITIDTDDEDLVYSFTKKGQDIAFEDIKEDDILLVRFSPKAARASDSDFIAIDVCDDVVEGQVSAIKTDDGDTYYTVNGTDYELVSGKLAAGNEYKLYLDATGRVVKYTETETAVNFAVVDRVYKDNNNDSYMIRLIKANGTREAYVAKDDTIAKAARDIAYANDTYDGTLDALIDRAVTYKTNSSGEINAITKLEMTSTGKEEYTESSTKVGGARMDSATQILDLSKIGEENANNTSNYTATDIKAGALSSFVDGEEYKVYYGHRPSGYNTYKFVIIVEGNALINATTAFAVIDTVGTTYTEDGTTVYTLGVYTDKNKGEVVSYQCDEDIDLQYSGLARGDVVVLGIDADGIVTDIANTKTVTVNGANKLVPGELFSASSFNANTMFAKTKAKDPKNMSANAKSYIESGISVWDNSSVTNNSYARVGFGIVLKNSNGVVTMARTQTAAANDVPVKDADGNIIRYEVNQNDLVSRDADIEEFTLANDANIYVYDKNYTGSSMLSVGSSGSIVKTFVADSSIIRNGAEDIYNWTKIAAKDGVAYTYAYYKVVDGDIQDIVVIIPKA